MTRVFLIALLLQILPCSADKTRIESIQLQNVSAEEVESSLSPLLEYNESIVSHHQYVIINASPAKILELKRIIHTLDTKPAIYRVSIIQDSIYSAHHLNHPKDNLNGHQYQTESVKNTQTIQTLKLEIGKPASFKFEKRVNAENMVFINTPWYSINSKNQRISHFNGFKLTLFQMGQNIQLKLSPQVFETNHQQSVEQTLTTSLTAQLNQWIDIAHISHTPLTAKKPSHAYSTQQNDRYLVIKINKTH